MKWNIGSTSTSAASIDPSAPLPPGHPPIASSSRGAKCPVDHAAMSKHTSLSSAAKCPVDHASSPKPTTSTPRSSAGAKCPVDHASMSKSRPAASPYAPSSASSSPLNPLNHIPAGLSATDRAPGQRLDLPTDRTSSTIPRPAHEAGEDANTEGTWDYPSPQQFYNALVRKGWETPEESIEMVVEIHNFLNEKAWEEVMKWEKRLPGGENAQLQRFQGRPGELSPKARLYLWAGQIFPSRFNTEPPFDRHDWIVTRPDPAAPSTSTSTSTTTTPAAAAAAPTTTTRYVIDYYSAPPDEDGNPVFSLDVRPALDSFTALSQRIQVSVEEWMRGGSE